MLKPSMAAVLMRRAAPVLGVLLFMVAVAILHHELAEYRLDDVGAAIQSLPSSALWLALALTVISYLALTGYDALACRFIDCALPYRRIAFASFIGYVVSHNIGLSFLGGSAVRYRLYSAWGLSATQVAQVVTFIGVTLWLGFLVLTGAALVAEPVTLLSATGVPPAAAVAIGTLCLALPTSYLVWCAVRQAPLRWGTIELSLPSPRIAAYQIALSAVDWAVAASVLYVLVAPLTGVSFGRLLGAFLLAQVAGLASHVPAGLGVFEAALLLLLGPVASGAHVIGALLAYRAIYYLLPLVVGVLLLGGYEMLEHRAAVARATTTAGGIASKLAPQAFALSTFLGGVVLLVSGALPAAPDRLERLAETVPLPVLEISHFVGSLVGVALLLLARGLQQRLDAAYVLACVLLAAGAGISLLKGLDYEEAIILCVMLAALIPCRRSFYRRSSLLAETLTPAWTAAILLAASGVGWLLVFAYRHVQYSHDLWWQFELSADVSRSLRASVAAAVGLACVGSARLLRPARPAPAPPGPDEIVRVRQLLAASPAVSARLALLGDKTFLFNDAGTAFIMYGVIGRSWVAMGDPVGPPNEARELAWEFRALSDRHGGWTIFYEVSPGNLPLYLDLGLALLKLGEEARVALGTLTLEGGARKGLRQTHHRLERGGCRFEIVPPDGIAALLPELRAISDAWLGAKNVREKGFSLGFFEARYLCELPLAVVRQEGRLVAFANLWLGAEREEATIDLMRYLPDSPPGLMDYLFVELLLWAKAEGYRWFSLGMAPLSGLENRALAPLWSRLGALLFRHGEHFYNFQGLRAYKEKFDPVWSPRYLALPGGASVPPILANVAALISGGLKGVVTK